MREAAALLLWLALAGARAAGTAIVVAPDLLLTNHHVVGACTAVAVRGAGIGGTGQVAGRDPVLDLALVRFAGPYAAIAAFRPRATVRPGEPAFVYGYPAGVDATQAGVLAGGQVSALHGPDGSPVEIQLTAALAPGHSGAAVVDRSARVIGVAVGKLVVAADPPANHGLAIDVGLAVALPSVLDFLDRHAVRYRAGDPGPALAAPELAAAARGFTVQVGCAGAPPAAARDG